MRIPVDRKSEIPIYRQIEAHIRGGIESGTLPPETRLPATRALAKDLGVNRITVETAYAGLEADGLVYTRVGSGTYVHPPVSGSLAASPDLAEAWPLWQLDLHEGAESLGGSTGAAAGHPDPISLAGGVGDPRLFPAEDFRKVVQSVMRRDGIEALGYGDRAGYEPLRETIARVLASQGVPVRADHVLITAGSQQGLALVSQLLLRRGEAVLVESPTYSGALDLFRSLGARVVGVPVDDRGMKVELLEEQLQQHHPKLVYTVPNFQNPTGTCLGGDRRRRLIALASRYNVPILEDDFVGDLRYEGRAEPALKALDPGGRVLYASTFSKMLIPGIRVGFVAADGPVLAHLLRLKKVHDLATSNLMQRALEAYVTVGRYRSHLRRSVRVYRKRRDTLLEAVRRHLPSGCRIHRPRGGLFAWLQFPDGVSASAALAQAREEGVEFDPGDEFFPERERGDRFARLNFASQPPGRIDEGMKRLGTALRDLGSS